MHGRVAEQGAGRTDVAIDTHPAEHFVACDPTRSDIDDGLEMRETVCLVGWNHCVITAHKRNE
ncbi:hypothetical protein GCM10007392_38730 [Saccharospirillum salsuginis]|uniref:Uncharacterized protein n=1 Tax=Saccharospirillum salsuginis TaxID=418750 RepID=A0A918NHE7_9GAMM|nr:hypothetical protein GCM10007392_38730 [Saccharospirillum salsuginis]